MSPPLVRSPPDKTTSPIAPFATQETEVPRHAPGVEPAPRLGVLERWGSALISPRAGLSRVSPTDGRWDAAAMLTLYALGRGVPTLGDGLASLLALGVKTGGFTLLAAGARVMLAPVLVMVAIESVLGNERGYRRGFFLVPFVAVAVLGHGLETLGVGVGRALGGGFVGALWPELLGGVLALASAWAARDAVAVATPSSTPSPKQEGPAA